MSNPATWRDFETAQDIRSISNVPSLISIALQSQYASSQKYRNLANLFQSELDSCPQLDQFFQYILNPQTSEGIWLDWWGKRLGVTRNLVVDGVDTRLDDDFYKFLILYRAVANVSNSTAYTINSLLTRLIGLPCFLTDYQDMTVAIRVVGTPTEVQISILRNYGLLNRPAGVLVNITAVNPQDLVLGFYGQNLQPFNQGVFNSMKEIPI